MGGFFQKMKADYYRYIAEFKDGDAKSKAAESASGAYADAKAVAEKDLAVTHPIRLGLVLNYSVFQCEVLSNPDEACKMARTAFEDAIADLDNVAEDSYKDSTSSCSCSGTTSPSGPLTKRAAIEIRRSILSLHLQPEALESSR